MEKKIVIQGQDLRIGYRTGKQEKVVHEHLDFELRAGELTCLLGANGAGKSTLLRTLSASQPSLGGELKMLGKPLKEYTEKERSRTIGVVLTDKTFAGGLSVYELVALGRQPHTGFFGRLSKEDKRIIEEAMENVMPQLECKTRRVGGANYQVPMEVRADRRQTLGLRWLTQFSRTRSERTMKERLAAEILDAVNGVGNAAKKRDEMHRTAEANRAFAHYRW